jgi:hypothetical protein
VRSAHQGRLNASLSVTCPKLLSGGCRQRPCFSSPGSLPSFCLV